MVCARPGAANSLPDFVPDADELPIARLRHAGVVIVGKTNVPEFTLHGYTDNRLFGVTRNHVGIAHSRPAVPAAVAPLRLSPPAWERSRSEPTAAGRSAGLRRYTGLVGFGRRAIRSRAPAAFPRSCMILKSSARSRDVSIDVIATMRVIADNWSALDRDPPKIRRRILYHPDVRRCAGRSSYRRKRRRGRGRSRTAWASGRTGRTLHRRDCRLPISGPSSAGPVSPGFWLWQPMAMSAAALRRVYGDGEKTASATARRIM